MLRLIFAILTAAPLLLAAGSAQAGEKNCTDVRCDWVHHRAQGPKPAVPNMVCIYFVQPHKDKVLLTVFKKDGTVRLYPPKWAGKSGSFCIGRHWVEVSTLINICNETTGSANYLGADLAELRKKPQNERELVACLYGFDECREMGFKSKHVPVPVVK